MHLELYRNNLTKHKFVDIMAKKGICIAYTIICEWKLFCYDQLIHIFSIAGVFY